MRAAAGLVGAALLVATVGSPRAALAVLDPTRAQNDVEDAIHEKGYVFCSAPHEPLSEDDAAVCGHAKAIPECDGLARACAKLSVSEDVARPPSPFLLGFLGNIAKAIVWMLVAAIVLAVIVPIVRALARARKDRPLSEPERAASPEPRAVVDAETIADEEVLLRRAEQLAREGRYAEAVQVYLLASLRALDKRGAVRISRDRTNGEYVRGCKDAAAKGPLRDIVREVDRAQFGGEPPTVQAAAAVRERAMAIVRAPVSRVGGAPPPLTAVILLIATLGCTVGCSEAAGLKGAAKPIADRPSGDEVLRELLRRQGVHVEGLGRSLASLEPAKAGEREAAVLVDAERTELDVLLGAPSTWPRAFGEAKRTTASGKLVVRAKRLISHSASGPAYDEEEEDDDDRSPASPEPDAGAPSAAPDDTPVFAEDVALGTVVQFAALDFAKDKLTVAWFEAGPAYAAVVTVGKGYVLGVASDELLTNAALARPGNAALLVAILSNADRLRFRIAEPDDGVSPPSSPLAALTRAGLGLGLVHGLFATLVLFLAVGVRLARPKPAPPPTRRAFAEHVEAVGALYARTRSASHALAAYARFADERLRDSMPRGMADVPAFLASRARLPLESCQRLWGRAMAAKAGAPPVGDELAVLKELSAVYSAATARD
jgi:hypothetical protein